MRSNTCSYMMMRLAGLVILAAGLATSTPAGDLPAASDGEHLWLIEQAPAPKNNQDADPKLVIYHLPTDGDRYLATRLDPVAGQRMPRGLAAGDGRLLLVTDDRKLITLRPEWSELMRRHVYQQRTLTPLPEGCTLVSLAMGDRGPWALVQVQSRELLEKLDRQDVQQRGPTDQQIFNKALGLPEELQWDEPGQDQAGGGEADPEGGRTDAADDAQPDDVPKLPAYRLIHLSSRQWISSTLPDGLTIPREAVLLIRPGDDRPTLLIDSDTPRGPALVRYNPVAPIQPDPETETEPADEQAAATPPAWARLVTGMQLHPGRRWSADLVNGQIVVALERYRPREVVTIDTFLLRGDNAYEIGYANLSIGDGARWALFPKQNSVGLIASPAPQPAEGTPDQLPPLALLAGLSFDGKPLFSDDAGNALLMPITEKKPTLFEGNADLLIQILIVVAAMVTMLLFYRPALQQDQVDLPEHLVLASLGRRTFAALIDLAPGFFLATLLYDLSVSEILLKSWPGMGPDKAFAAMRPGFIVIGVTLLHTTVMEFIMARSLGKYLMGLYVADLNGKPAPPLPCLGRALSRVFELIAPFILLVAVISPARQRLGDILARTTVVMRKPEPPPEPGDE